MQQNGRRSGNNVRNKRAEERREKLMVGRTVMIVLFCAVLFIVGVYVTLYFVDWERIQGLHPLIS
jgi:ABC-type Fe3+ transport system permease subunit